jgi:signal transduction histidine kinase/HAMP domain-containing protein/ActR/RegA family two-component response regulator
MTTGGDMINTPSAPAGEARYSDSDLEPLRAALQALSNGDFAPQTLAAARSAAGGVAYGNGSVLGQIWPLVDAVASELSSLNDEVARRAEQVRDIAMVTTAVARGDLTKQVTVDVQGEMLQLKQTVNTMVDQLSAFADEVTRVAREVGTEGRLGGQAHVRGVSGVWKDLTDSVNGMASNLTVQVRNIAQVATAVAQGDLSQKVTVDVQGEMLQLKQTVNTMVDQLSAFADEVTRVAREVGTEGILGGQADVKGVSGIWKDLTDNVNSMAGNLTSQVRNIAQVTTAVAQGDLSKKIDVAARGEILELKTTINTMVDQLSAFADEVTRVAREVGTEGRLGGQAEVEGVSGTWKRLTESVNGLASNLTTQVRAIAAVASAVAEGDLTQSITVNARGEVAELKDNINLMVANLRETTSANREQDWLNTNLARLSSLMQGHRDPHEVARLIMSELTPLVSAQYGAFYLATGDEDTTGAAAESMEFKRIAAYGFHKSGLTSFTLGEGLTGQAALDKTRILIGNAPPGYVTVGSGLGEASPTSVVVLPILFEDQVLGVLELASLHKFSDLHLMFFDRFVPTIGVTINAIMANSRTEVLLTESQRLATQLQERSDELQRQQGELRRSNAELEEKAALLAKQNRAIEVQNFQIDQARRTLEERAQQLALSSQYKSEFLANMSHELRTPLNSLLVLAKLLSENPDGNLTLKQVEFARTIHEAGSDLLQLINDILDLSKVEAGKMEVHPAAISLDGLLEYVDATFRPMAAQKGLAFQVEVASGVPTLVYSDEQRLQQIVRNLLSNAVKFTHTGAVTLRVSQADEDMRFTGPLRDEKSVLAFQVKDTGIGIAEDKLELIFGAFQQADGTTSRGYGGTGLGLSISRDIARLLGGEIHATSRPGHGSTFTFYLPDRQEADGGPDPLAGGWDETPELSGTDGRDSLALPGPDDGLMAAGPRLNGSRDRVIGSAGADIDDDTLAGARAAAKRAAAGARRRIISRRESAAGSAVAGSGTLSREDELGGAEETRIVSTSGLPDISEMPDTDAVAPEDDPLNGAKILIVDDDVRNVFALTSVFERYGAQVRYAENGRQGMEILDREDDVALVLMDVMMPELDGYATTAAIRQRPEFADLPIITVTAKAMKGDRAKSIAAGASEYVTKPVDIAHLISLMRSWLERRRRAEGNG